MAAGGSLTLLKLTSHPEDKGVVQHPALTAVNDMADTWANTARTDLTQTVDIDALRQADALEYFWSHASNTKVPLRQPVKQKWPSRSVLRRAKTK